MKPASKIIRSSNYGDFYFIKGNRPVDPSLKQYKLLKESMTKHGWIESYPVTVFISNGKKGILDGQNRFSVAVELKIPIIYVVVDEKFSVTEVNEPHRAWSGKDYASSHADRGNQNYIALMEFCKSYRVSPTRAVSLFRSLEFECTDGGGRAADVLKDGSFKYSADGLKHASSVLEVCDLLPEKLRRNRAANAAISKVVAVKEVDVEVLSRKINANQKFITPRLTVDEYVHMLETVYNKRNDNPVAISVKVLNLSRSK